LIKLSPSLSRDQVVVVNLSGRGDKDCQEVARLIGASK
jgi:tryptophan synthase beta chain